MCCAGIDTGGRTTNIAVNHSIRWYAVCFSFDHQRASLHLIQRSFSNEDCRLNQGKSGEDDAVDFPKEIYRSRTRVGGCLTVKPPCLIRGPNKKPKPVYLPARRCIAETPSKKALSTNQKCQFQGCCLVELFIQLRTFKVKRERKISRRCDFPNFGSANPTRRS